VKTSRSHSLNENAIDLDKSSGIQVSRQAIDKQLNSFTEKILKEIFAKVLEIQRGKGLSKSRKRSFSLKSG